MDDKKTITITIEEYNLLLEKQKQVDELKKKLWKSKQDMMKYHSKTVAEAVKDTAKDIFAKVKSALNYLDNEWEISNALYPLEKEYGVEVE
jgi:hypothetical protein